MAFSDLLKKHAAFATSPKREGEQVTYKPLGQEPGKTINAVVRRKKPEADGADYGRSIRATLEIIIVNDAALGVTTVTPRKDQVTVALEVGGTPQDILVDKVINATTGFFHLRLSK